MSDFQRRHYEALASVICAIHDNQGVVTCSGAVTRAYMAEKLTALFAADNLRFDRSRFLKACGIDTGKEG